MSHIELAQVQHDLNQFEHPHLIPDWANQPGVVWQAKSGEFQIGLPFASYSAYQALTQWLKDFAPNYPIALHLGVKPMQTQHGSTISGVKNVIAVTSAKGGVGKSTTAVNLALALSRSGARVGILDADIYGPSVPIMLGTQSQKPLVTDNKWMQPILEHGIFSQSIGYLVDANDAAIWRGPMASKALMQLINETQWPQLDYLVLDMPPGTGDIQLTLSQQIPVTGAVVVTTPQDLALADAIKGVAMFDKVEVPVLGVIENMSYHICENCGHHSAIFGEQGTLEMAKAHDLALLGQIPLDIKIRSAIDHGAPTMVSDPSGDIATQYQELADQIACRLFWQGDVASETILFTQAK
ncbi:MAG: iron-sulfur cluster carrier protein ApbC [Vibrio sp.]